MRTWRADIDKCATASGVSPERRLRMEPARGDILHKEGHTEAGGGTKLWGPLSIMVHSLYNHVPTKHPLKCFQMSHYGVEIFVSLPHTAAGAAAFCSVRYRSRQISTRVAASKRFNILFIEDLSHIHSYHYYFSTRQRSNPYKQETKNENKKQTKNMRECNEGRNQRTTIHRICLNVARVVGSDGKKNIIFF